MTDPVFVDLSTAPPPEGSAPAHGTPVPPITFDGPAGYPDEVIEQLTAEALPIIARYPQSRSALLPLLHLVQSHDGRLTRAGVEFCAAQLDLTPAQVASVATFYSMYRRTPTGEYLVGVCTNTLCATLGGDEILRSVCEHLGVEPGDTTADHRITVEHVECNAACDFAPVVMVNWEFFDDQTPESTIELIEDLRAGVEVTPARGTGPVRSFRETEHDLAGVAAPSPSPLAEPPTSPLVQPTPPLAEPTPPLVEPAPSPMVEPTPSPLVEPAPSPLVEPAPSEARRRVEATSQPPSPLVEPAPSEARSRVEATSQPPPPLVEPAPSAARSRVEATSQPPQPDPEPEPPETPILSRHWDEPQSWTLDNYLRHNGYRALSTALTTPPDDIIETVKASGLRGRGGAGFPVGMKWSFIPQKDSTQTDPSVPHYLVVNADESEPGTCKDMPLMLASPHTLVEGVIIAAYAIRAHHAFIYVRGEVASVLRRLRTAVDEAYAAGYLGTDILGSGFDLELVVHAGAGAYICGEETALLDSLEGRRGQPRLRPPFPAVAGLYASPTVVNNVESIASVPAIIRNGVDWFRSMGTEKSPGFTLYSLSGHVTRPGQYEAPLGVSLRELLDRAGGVRAGHELKFWTPGGSSTPLLTPEHLDVPLDYEGVGAAGSMLGTKALQIFDETTCVVGAVLRWTEFYEHESCGKCTPCREGTYWLVQLLHRLEHEGGTAADLDTLADVTNSIVGKSFCALGDGAGSPIVSSLKYFRDEYLAHLDHGCPFDHSRSTVWAGGVR
ncbi:MULTISPECIES: NADH-quinone oxidoreductase subunit NuoF [unclassified Gordonia (in: high G+C Gram-positive bacteria)]|uniref:NADH-quinone oxidoreductase subunit NuoF n=1 Tax=unclassified Gordonia (in: high G+C Gram-positive bacteria) TaxID=2657482 RepID=UPI0020CA731B|nr:MULTISPECIES: NADH-quinone oxidoreductase subunit NuoF [unclassified Gordonia (in: high G+C Gram-positive bacteria)]MCX2754160.1 NADH-quinone oxidoreductase subunit NuoF [Gordonia sp. 4N]